MKKNLKVEFEKLPEHKKNIHSSPNEMTLEEVEKKAVHIAAKIMRRLEGAK